MLNIKGAVAIAACLAAAVTAGTARADNVAAHSRTSQLIIQYRGNSVRPQSVKRNQPLPGFVLPDGRPVKFLRRFNDDAMVVQLPEAVSLEEARRISAQLATQTGIASVEPDRRLYPALTPNDPEYPPGADPVQDPGQWHLFETTAGIRMPAAWDQSTGSSGIVIAVLDTGLIPHRDLNAARVLPGYDFFSDTARDNDGTPGRDSDPSDPGDATIDGECGVGELGEDSSWHGLSVAGVIAATANNSTDIAGIDFNARLLPIRVLGKCGGDLSDVADAVRWAAGLPVAGVPANPNPADVINLSLSGDGLCTAAEQSAIDAAVANGAVVVVAAGNEAANVADVSPANCRNVIAVGAIARDGRIAAYANVGLNVDLTAPGGDDPDPPDPLNDPPNGILTLSNFGVTTAGADAVAVIQGTSFTAAQVSAVSSLMLAVNGALTPGLVTDILKATARTFPDPSCDTSLCGTGVLDAAAALAAAANPGTIQGNLPPTASAGGPYSGVQGAAILFDGSGSFDPESQPLSYSWDFGDDSFATGVNPEHVYAVAGTFTVTLVVNDGIADSPPSTATVTVSSSGDKRVDPTGGGGGCSLSASTAIIDPVWLILLLSAALYAISRPQSR
jgi:serine protease